MLRVFLIVSREVKVALCRSSHAVSFKCEVCTFVGLRTGAAEAPKSVVRVSTPDRYRTSPSQPSPDLPGM
jgi:hypothetical protein